MKIEVIINGVPRTFHSEPGDKVIDLLRREGFLSLRNGCDGQGFCGTCAILLDGLLVNSCLLLAPQIHGKSIYTAEGLASGRKLHIIQNAFIESGIVQCGYCTTAMEMAVKDLLDRHPDPTKDQIKDALSGLFCRCTGYQQIFNAVELAARRMQQPEWQRQMPTFGGQLRVIGKDCGKIDGPQLVKGEACYVEDMVKPGSLHVKMLASPHAHAIITAIDTSEAEKIPGVAYILTHNNAPDIFYSSAGQGYPEPSPYDRKLIDRKVRFIGDRVAAVAAESPAIAAEAAAKIKVEYQILPAVFTIDQARQPGAPQVHERDISIDPIPLHADPSRNIAAHNQGGIGDVEAGWRQADVILERTYRTTPVQCTPLEPHVVYCYTENDRLIIHASTQVPWHMRRIIATLLGISQNKIRVIKERVGGGFGAKQDIVLEDVAAWIAWQTGRPVFYRYNRQEEFISSRIRHPMEITVKMGAKRDGTLTAMQMNVLANTGAYGVHALTVPMNACSKSLPLFKCTDVKYSVTAYYTNLPISGAYQGYGAPQGSFAVQVLAAELAEKLGMDFYDFLEKNRVGENYRLEILKCLGEGQEGIAQVISSCGLAPALAKGHEWIAWGQRESSSNPDIKIGKGVVIIQQGSGLPGIDSANAEVKMMADGTMMLLIGGTDLGTGLDTMAVKMAAECLQMDPESVSLLAADTDVTPFDVGAYASSGTYFTGSAALNAARNMKEKILQVAATMLKRRFEDLQLHYPMQVVTPEGKSVSFADIASYTQGGSGPGQLIANASFTTTEAPIPYGAHFAQVSVNTRTGQLKIDKYFALQDCGTPINPVLATGQVYGGVLKAIGHSLFEEMIFDDNGRCLNPNLLDYKVPMIADLPEDFRVELIETDDPLGPFGAKSVSEISTNGSAPVIAIAIHDAIGVWMREWPFTPEKIIRALNDKEKQVAK